MTTTQTIESLVEKAVAKRAALIDAPDLDAYRLVNGSADGLSGLVIERLGSVLIVQFHEGRLEVDSTSAAPVVESLLERFGLQAAYAKHFVRDRSELSDEQNATHTDAKPWLGRAVEARIAVHEGEAEYIIRPYDGFSYGLFLEQRDNRRRVMEMSNGKSVLNLFCYTCGFTVAAALGGASEITSVDLSKRYLDWGRNNLELNGADMDCQKFICSDTFDYYKRAERQGRTFDVIVLDPPTFSRMRRPTRTFVLEKQIGQLMAGAVKLLAPGGHLLFSTNNRSMNTGRLEKELHRASGGRTARVISRPELPIDFAGDPDYSHSIIARVQ